MSDIVEIIAAGMWNAADSRVGTHVPWDEWAPTEPKQADEWRFLSRATLTALEERGYVVVKSPPGIAHEQEPYTFGIMACGWVADFDDPRVLTTDELIDLRKQRPSPLEEGE